MQSFKQFLEEHLISESDFNQTWKNYGAKISERMKSDKSPMFSQHAFAKQSPEQHREFFNNLITQADPSHNKKFQQWLGKTYASEGIKQLEDIHGRASAALDKFHKNKHRLAQHGISADINQHKSLGDLEGAMERLPEDEKKKADTAAVEKARKEAEHHEDEHWWIKVPTTEHASKHYGAGTRWCTAADKNCMFNHYAKEGKLHIFIPKNPEYPGEKYQMHLESGSMMNEKDEEPEGNPFEKRPSKYLYDMFDRELEKDEKENR